jgi:hypothetical protein
MPDSIDLPIPIPIPIPIPDNIVRVPSARSRSAADSVANHYGDDRLREIVANKLRALHVREQETEAQTQSWKLKNAEVELAYGALYFEAKGRCKALREPFGRWLKKFGFHKWRMANYLMKAVRLEVDSQCIANLGVVKAIAKAEDREPSAALEISKARREANSRRLAALQSLEALDLVIQGIDPREFIEACRHRARPYPRIQRPGHGIEHLMIDSGAYSAYN